MQCCANSSQICLYIRKGRLDGIDNTWDNLAKLNAFLGKLPTSIMMPKRRNHARIKARIYDIDGGCGYSDESDRLN